MEKQRIHLIDAARGLAVLLMVGHHALYNLMVFYNISIPFLHSNLFFVLQFIFSGLFIFVSGLCCRFSKSNLKRGVIAFSIGLIISIVTITAVPNNAIYFGILHFLGSSMIIYSLLGRFFEKLNDMFSIIAFFITFMIASWFLPTSTTISPYLFPFGLVHPTFRSSDYFPIFPFIFLFISGTGFGGLVKANKLPKWFYETKVKFLPVVGRNSLTIYVVHQPILIAMFWIISQTIVFFN